MSAAEGCGMSSAFEFFIPPRQLNRHTAARAVAAGTVAAGLCFLLILLKSAGWLIVDKSISTRVMCGAAALLFTVAVGVLTWKRYVVGPVFGILVSITLMVLMAEEKKIAGVALLTPVLIGGFWSAARGIRFFVQQKKSARANGSG